MALQNYSPKHPLGAPRSGSGKWPHQIVDNKIKELNETLPDQLKLRWQRNHENLFKIYNDSDPSQIYLANRGGAETMRWLEGFTFGREYFS